MAVTSITLADPARGLSSLITPRDGIAVAALDVAPAVRAVAEPRQGGHGSSDTTQFLDAATAALTLLLYGDSQSTLADELGAYCHPAARSQIVVTDGEWDGPRFLTVRFDSKSAPRTDPASWPVQLSFDVPAGIWEAATPVTASLPAIVAGLGGGLTWTSAGLTWTSAGLTWAAASATSPSQVQSQGNVETDWTAILYGPCVAPALANDTAGLTLEFTSDLTLSASDYVVLDSAARSALLNGQPGSSALGFLNWATSDWWAMQPGLNLLRYYPDSGTGASTQAAVTFRPGWACT